jgi:hypothetical protein
MRDAFFQGRDALATSRIEAFFQGRDALATSCKNIFSANFHRIKQLQ